MTLKSLFRLGWHFVKRILCRAFGLRQGLSRFQKNYFSAGLLPLTKQDRDILSAGGRCIQCGSCDLHFQGYRLVSRSQFRGPSDLASSFSRSLPDFDLLTGLLRNLEKGDLEALEKICPVRVPFRDLAALAVREGTRLNEAKNRSA